MFYLLASSAVASIELICASLNFALAGPEQPHPSDEQPETRSRASRSNPLALISPGSIEAPALREASITVLARLEHSVEFMSSDVGADSSDIPSWLGSFSMPISRSGSAGKLDKPASI